MIITELVHLASENKPSALQLSLKNISLTHKQLMDKNILMSELDPNIKKAVSEIRKGGGFQMVFSGGGANGAKEAAATAKIMEVLGFRQPLDLTGTSSGAIAAYTAFCAGSSKTAWDRVKEDAYQISWKKLTTIKRSANSSFGHDGIFSFKKMADWLGVEGKVLNSMRNGEKTAKLLILVTYDRTDKEPRFFFFTDPNDEKIPYIVAASCSALPFLSSLNVEDRDGVVHQLTDIGFNNPYANNYGFLPIGVSQRIGDRKNKILALRAAEFSEKARMKKGPSQDDLKGNNVLVIDLHAGPLRSDFVGQAIFFPKNVTKGLKSVGDNKDKILQFLG